MATPPLGPQHKADDAFTARMRLHQSWYRAHVLNVDCGVGPNPHSQPRYGNMLSADDGERGLNFLTPEIAAYARARQQEFPAGIKAHRLFCNMLSSQPMCFNLFAPLALDAELAAPLLGALLGTEVARVDKVILEHAPAPKADYLDDSTSFDAYVEYRRPDGARGFVGIETKLTEPFSQADYPISKTSYSRWVEHKGSPWLTSSRAMLDARGHNQLWRNHMLGFANATRATAPYAAWSVAVVRHPLDRKCRRVRDVRSVPSARRGDADRSAAGPDRGPLAPNRPRNPLGAVVARARAALHRLERERRPRAAFRISRHTRRRPCSTRTWAVLGIDRHPALDTSSCIDHSRRP